MGVGAAPFISTPPNSLEVASSVYPIYRASCGVSEIICTIQSCSIDASLIAMLKASGASKCTPFTEKVGNGRGGQLIINKQCNLLQSAVLPIRYFHLSP